MRSYLAVIDKGKSSTNRYSALVDVFIILTISFISKVFFNKNSELVLLNNFHSLIFKYTHNFKFHQTDPFSIAK